MTLQVKILSGSGRAGGDGICGCRSPPWRRRRVCRHFSCLLGVGRCLRAKALVRCGISMMAASSMSSLCWEHCARRHGLEVLCCAPPVFAAALVRSSPVQCTVVGGESKMVLFSGRIESCHPLATSFRHQGGMVRRQEKLLRVVVLRR